LKEEEPARVRNAMPGNALPFIVSSIPISRRSLESEEGHPRWRPWRHGWDRQRGSVQKRQLDQHVRQARAEVGRQEIRRFPGVAQNRGEANRREARVTRNQEEHHSHSMKEPLASGAAVDRQEDCRRKR
jgi:hypothetical protein